MLSVQPFNTMWQFNLVLHYNSETTVSIQKKSIPLIIINFFGCMNALATGKVHWYGTGPLLCYRYLPTVRSTVRQVCNTQTATPVVVKLYITCCPVLEMSGAIFFFLFLDGVAQNYLCT